MSGRLLMPGLVDAHCHSAMTLLRGVGSDLPLDKWLFEEMMPIEDKLTAEDIAAGNELAMMEMIASGVTSFSDMYMEPRTAIRSNEKIGMKMNVCRVLQAFDPNEPPEQNKRIPESVELYEEMHGAQNGRGAHRLRRARRVHQQRRGHEGVRRPRPPVRRARRADAGSPVRDAEGARRMHRPPRHDPGGVV